MADFPGSFFSFRTIVNLPGIVYDALKTTHFFAEDIQALVDEITAVEEAMGINPQGSFDTVDQRIAALESEVGVGGTWGEITGTLSDQTDLQAALDAKQNSLGFTAENVANKSTSVVADSGSSTKYPTVKSVYDWAVGAFQAALGFTPENVANKQTDLTASATKYPTVNAVNTGLATKQDSLGFTAENVANKDTDSSMAANSDTKYPSQKAVKTALAGKQDSLGFTAVPNTRTVAGHALSADVTISASDVGLGSVTNDVQLKAADKDTDGTLAANSDTKIPSQKAVKTYVDNHAPANAVIETIASGSFPAAATLSITGISPKYRMIQIYLNGVSCNTATRILKLKLSTNNGSSYITSNYRWVTTTLSDSATSEFWSAVGSMTAAGTLEGVLMITCYQGGAYPTIESRASRSDTGTHVLAKGNYLGGTSAVDALQFFWDGSGNFDAGTYAVYGVL